jgi:hypothetical protein
LINHRPYKDKFCRHEMAATGNGKGLDVCHIDTKTKCCHTYLTENMSERVRRSSYSITLDHEEVLFDG